MSEAINSIQREHQDILLMVEIMAGMVQRYQEGNALTIEDMPAVTRYFLRYADYLHHAKEEIVLFPAIAARDQESITMLDLLLEEHQQLRKLLSQLDAHLQQGDREAYFTVLQGFIRLLRTHVEQEDQLLLPTIATFFTADEEEALAERLANVADERMTREELGDWANVCARLVRGYRDELGETKAAEEKDY